jgi:hypothetical protein
MVLHPLPVKITRGSQLPLSFQLFEEQPQICSRMLPYDYDQEMIGSGPLCWKDSGQRPQAPSNPLCDLGTQETHPGFETSSFQMILCKTFDSTVPSKEYWRPLLISMQTPQQPRVSQYVLQTMISWRPLVRNDGFLLPCAPAFAWTPGPLWYPSAEMTQRASQEPCSTVAVGVELRQETGAQMHTFQVANNFTTARTNVVAGTSSRIPRFQVLNFLETRPGLFVQGVKSQDATNAGLAQERDRIHILMPHYGSTQTSNPFGFLLVHVPCTTQELAARHLLDPGMFPCGEIPLISETQVPTMARMWSIQSVLLLSVLHLAIRRIKDTDENLPPRILQQPNVPMRPCVACGRNTKGRCTDCWAPLCDLPRPEGDCICNRRHRRP